MLTQEAIKEFQALWYKNTGIRLSDEEVKVKAARIFRLLKLVTKPNIKSGN